MSLSLLENLISNVNDVQGSNYEVFHTVLPTGEIQCGVVNSLNNTIFISVKGKIKPGYTIENLLDDASSTLIISLFGQGVTASEIDALNVRDLQEMGKQEEEDCKVLPLN